ncbi:MAG TPA: sodium:alanine symporter family protein, partial [Sutterella sp.]|nr:sodium:alanine symporter family protein [Sutterella sp.]
VKEKPVNMGAMSSFGALMVSTASRVGTGNIMGVSTALCLGGPGAIFWMWIAAFFGMATICVEAVLAQLYKDTDSNGNVTGGPAFYITNGLRCKPLAVFFALAIIAALGFIGNMVQANSIASAFDSAFGIPAPVIGFVLAIIAAFIFLGGIGRIASTTEKIVPLMAVLYLIGGFTVLGVYADQILPALKMIFVGAFNPEAATGGVIGATVKEAIRYGVARGLFSNEAGMGSTPHAHAVAKVKYPAQQGLVAIMGVFIDTFIVLNMTALVILTTGVLDGKTTGIQLTQHAFQVGLGPMGYGFVAVCLLFFAFSTIIGWYFFAEQNVKFLFGAKAVPMYQIIVVLFIFAGSMLQVNLVWELADLFNGLMVLPNLIALLGLGKLASKAFEEYEKNRVPGEDRLTE